MLRIAAGGRSFLRWVCRSRTGPGRRLKVSWIRRISVASTPLRSVPLVSQCLSSRLDAACIQAAAGVSTGFAFRWPCPRLDPPVEPAPEGVVPVRINGHVGDQPVLGVVHPHITQDS